METYIIIALLVAVIILEIIILVKKSGAKSNDLDQALDNFRNQTADEFQRNRKEIRDEINGVRGLLSENKADIGKILNDQHKDIMKSEIEQQEKLYNTLNNQSNKITSTLSDVVGKLQESNEKKLEEMRVTVDEKLTDTLTKRLDSSFKTVGEQLQNVYKSLGEMRELSTGVSDLQRLLTNVKARGTWAEVQLGNILEQTLTSDQFERNVSIKNNNERVEFAIKIPSRDDDGSYVWLPIDSKFPQEDYLRLQEAADNADKEAVERCGKELEKIIKKEAATISSLYIDVPKTTDFAIMFLPTEGLYAEVLRRSGLVEELQHKYRIMVCGPTTVTAFLNTLKMGFRTIALDKRAAEVWKVLGAAKTQYDTFEVILAKVRKKINEAGNAIDDAQKRNGIIKKKLKNVEELDSSQADEILDSILPATDSEE